MDISSFLSDRIFYSTLWSFRPTCSTEQVRKDIRRIKKKHPEGNSLSNFGGWQSPTITSADLTHYPELTLLRDELAEFIELMSNKDGTPVSVKDIVLWANENEKHNYNKIHSHPTADYFAVYYSKYPETSGPLEVVRTDAGRLLSQNWIHPQHSEISLHGEEGRMYVFTGHLMHLVHPHASDKIRQSLAYNIQVGPPLGLQ